MEPILALEIETDDSRRHREHREFQRLDRLERQRELEDRIRRKAESDNDDLSV